MTDAPPIQLILHPTTESQFAGGRYLMGRAMGVTRKLGFIALPVVFAAPCGLLMTHLVDLPLDLGGLVTLYACIGAIFGNLLAQYLWGRRYRSHHATSALQKAPVPLVLSAEGVALQPRHPLPWSTVTAINRCKDFTLLQFSPVDAMVIRDADLPPGMTPEALSTRIAEWRQP